GGTAAEELRRSVPGDGGEGCSVEVHRRGRRRDHHRCNGRGVGEGAQAGRGLAGLHSCAGEGRRTFGAAAIVWNFLAAPLTYDNEARPNGQSSGTSMTRIVLYTTPYCGYCRAAKHLLSEKGVTFTEIDVSEDLELHREMTARAFGRGTVPQIFINDTHVGGYDELAELERAEKLDALLAEVDAVAAGAPLPEE